MNDKCNKTLEQLRYRLISVLKARIDYKLVSEIMEEPEIKLSIVDKMVKEIREIEDQNIINILNIQKGIIDEEIMKEPQLSIIDKIKNDIIKDAIAEEDCMIISILNNAKEVIDEEIVTDIMES